MAAKLSNEEFGARARANAAQRAERQRLRKLASGKVQVGHWLPATAKARLDTLAAALALSPSEVVTAAIMAYSMPETSLESAPALVADRPASSHRAVSSQTSASARDAAILKLQGEGLSLGAMAARLAAQGITTGTGNPLSKDTIHKVLKKARLPANGRSASNEHHHL